jgi:imidazolonepropionase-like amidohydrolase
MKHSARVCSVLSPVLSPIGIAAAALVMVAAALAAAGPPAGVVGPTYAIRGCRIVPVTGPPVDKGAIVIRDGLIEALGPADKVKVPEDAEVVEADGLIAYPGLVSAMSGLFIEQPAAARGEAATPEPEIPYFAGQAAPAEDRYPPGPGQHVLDQLKPRKASVESFHRAGFTTVLVAPTRGIFEGQSVVLNLNGEPIGPMVLRNGAALHINFTTERGGYPSSLMGTIAHIRQSFIDAGYYAARQAEYARSPNGLKRPEYDARLEALAPFVRDRRPVVFQCNNQEDIKRALKIVAEFKLNAMLAGATEAWRVADVLKKSPVPLLVGLDFRPPATSKYATQGEELRRKAEAEIYPANAAELAKAGLDFALVSGPAADGALVLRAVRAAVKAGLPKEAALKALTIQPARFLGLDKALGSLEPGKIANVVLVKGELLDEGAQVAKVFADGVLFKYAEVSK